MSTHKELSRNGFTNYLREENYYSNPEVCYINAQEEDIVHLMYILERFPHSILVRDNDQLHIEPAVGDIRVFRPPTLNRSQIVEPKLPPLIQEGQPAKRGEQLVVYLKTQGYKVGIATVPELIVVTAASLEEAKDTMKQSSLDHDNLLRTTMVETWNPVGKFVKIRNDIRQIFILRPPGNSDLV